MISEFDKIEQLFHEIDGKLKQRLDVYVIGGAVLLYRGIKDATKDIDLIISNKPEYEHLNETLISSEFKPGTPTCGVDKTHLQNNLKRADFRIDIFLEQVCERFSLTTGMITRAEQILKFKNINFHLCSNEDIFLFKTLTERLGDLEDCVSLAKRGLDWEVILAELNAQIEQSKQDIWVTFICGRLEELDDMGVNIPILEDVRGMAELYMEEFGERMGQTEDAK